MVETQRHHLQLFGSRTFSLNFSLASLNAIPASFFPTIMGSLQLINNSYALPFLVLLVTSVINFIIAMVFVGQSKKL